MARDLGLQHLSAGITNAMNRISGAMRPTSPVDLQQARLGRIKGDTQQQILDIFGDPESERDARIRASYLSRMPVTRQHTLTSQDYLDQLKIMQETAGAKKAGTSLSKVYDPASDAMVYAPKSQAPGMRAGLPVQYDPAKEEDISAIKDVASGYFKEAPDEIDDDVAIDIARVANKISRDEKVDQFTATMKAIKMLEAPSDGGSAIEKSNWLGATNIDRAEGSTSIVNAILEGVRKSRPELQTSPITTTAPGKTRVAGSKRPLSAFGG